MVFAVTWYILFGTCFLIVFKFYIVKHMVFPTVLKAWCLVPGFGTWFIDLTAQNDMMSALAGCMEFGTEIVYSILIIIRLWCIRHCTCCEAWCLYVHGA